VIWPSDVSPTKIIHIPDPTNPVEGVMDYDLHPGDDLEFDFDPLWGFGVKDLPSTTEFAVSDGSGFISLDAYENKAKQAVQADMDAWWSSHKILRLRPSPGTTEAGSFKLIIVKKNSDETKSLPPVQPQQFGSLSVTFDRIQITRKGVLALVDLDLRNTSDKNSIAVAMYTTSAPFIEAEQMKSSLVASDGTQFWGNKDAVLGIGIMNALPKNLSEIGPGETRKISLTYQSQWGTLGSISSVRLAAELVVNQNYNESEYINYQPKPATLPPYCKIESLVLDIPIAENNQGR
jgi:hypothetical protein